MAKEKLIKTNAMRILDKNKVEYEMLTYKCEDGKIDGISVAKKIGIDEKFIFKTLVTQGKSKELYVFVIPVSRELDLKKAAKAANEKSVEMIHVKDIEKYTGYIRGGCSPIGMKRLYGTFIESCGEALEFIIVSGGKIGYQIKTKPENLVEVTKAKFAQLTV